MSDLTPALYDQNVGKNNRDNPVHYNSKCGDHGIGDKFNKYDGDFEGAILP